MAKNERKINIGKTLLAEGKLEGFTQLEGIVTITFIRDALGRKDHRPVKAKIFDPAKFTVGNLLDLAKEMDCDPTLLWLLALKQLGYPVADPDAGGQQQKGATRQDKPEKQGGAH